MMLEVLELTKLFGGLLAVDQLSFQVKQGEILGIIGPNGAGKTTLLNMISGFFPSTTGKIIFCGQDITKLKAHQIAMLGIRRNFQASVLFKDLPVIQNVFTAFHLNYKTSVWNRLLRLPKATNEEKELLCRSEEILERMGLGAVKNEITKNLSHGYQRILGICIALTTHPKLLLLDEPLTGMNQSEIKTMVGLVKGIRDDGITIVMIEHNVKVLMSICDRIVVLNYGKKIAEGLPKEILENNDVIEAYLGKE